MPGAWPILPCDPGGQPPPRPVAAAHPKRDPGALRAQGRPALSHPQTVTPRRRAPRRAGPAGVSQTSTTTGCAYSSMPAASPGRGRSSPRGCHRPLPTEPEDPQMFPGLEFLGAGYGRGRSAERWRSRSSLRREGGCTSAPFTLRDQSQKTLSVAEMESSSRPDPFVADQGDGRLRPLVGRAPPTG